MIADWFSTTERWQKQTSSLLCRGRPAFACRGPWHAIRTIESLHFEDAGCNGQRCLHCWSIPGLTSCWRTAHEARATAVV